MGTKYRRVSKVYFLWYWISQGSYLWTKKQLTQNNISVKWRHLCVTYFDKAQLLNCAMGMRINPCINSRGKHVHVTAVRVMRMWTHLFPIHNVLSFRRQTNNQFILLWYRSRDNGSINHDQCNIKYLIEKPLSDFQRELWL